MVMQYIGAEKPVYLAIKNRVSIYLYRTLYKPDKSRVIQTKDPQTTHKTKGKKEKSRILIII